MILALTPHPDALPSKPLAIDVAVACSAPRSVVLIYRVSGRIADLRIPPLLPSARRDGLWQHTCFEAFLRAPGEAGYHEFNLAPSTEWAAYRFDGYRSGMEAARVEPPAIEIGADAKSLELRALVDPPFDLPWQLGLSAVIEEADGRKSYWALAHAPGKADFHHPDSFAHLIRADL